MITCVCLNPCMDKALTTPAFAYGGMNRVRIQRLDPSGKGMNVALNIQRLGGTGCCTGFVGEENGRAVLDKLEAEGVRHCFVPIPGAVRTNIKLMDEKTRTVTEINEAGPPVPPQALETWQAMALALARESSHLIITGSLPGQCPGDLYAQLIRQVHDRAPGCLCVLDCEGASFAAGITAAPDLIKPNRFELELYAGRALPALEDVLAVSLGLAEKGVGMVAASLGGEGALITDGKRHYFAPALSVALRSTVGAGDAMLAGLTLALSQGRDLAEAFCYGVAAAAAKVQTEGTQPVLQSDVAALLGKVQLERL